MPINARFTADFSSFVAAIDKAQVELVDFGKGAETVQKKLNKMVDDFSGRKLIQEASLLTIAIEKAGGVSTLTARELGQVGAKANDAADKLKKLGYDVPVGLQKLADETKGANTQLSNMNGIVSGLAGAFGAAFTVGAVVNFGKQLLADADALTKLHDKTGISVEGLQRFQVAADDAGNTLDDITSAIVKMEDKLVSGDKSAAGALQKLGLSFEDLKGLSPENQFIKISDALREMKDPAEQVNVAIDLFGKQGANVLPTLKRGFDDLKDSTVGMSEDTVRALDDAGDAWDRWWRKAKGVSAEVVVGFGRMVSEGFNPWTRAANEAEREAENLARKIEELARRAAAAAPKLPIGAPIDFGLALGRGDVDREDFERKTRESEAATKRLNAEQKRRQEQFDKETEVLARWTANMELAASGTDRLERNLKGLGVELPKSDWDKNAIALERWQRSAAAGADSASELANNLRGLSVALPKMPSLSFGQQLSEDLKKSLMAVPQMLASAFTGGGDIGGAIRGIASNLGSAIGNTVGKTFAALGKFGGPIGAAVGSLAGPLIDIFGKLFENPEKKINPIREAFVQAAGGLDALNKKAHDAGLTLDRLLNAKNPEQYQAAIDELTKAFDAMKAKIDADSTAVGLLLKSFGDLGGGQLPSGLQGAIQKLIDLGKITGDTASLFASLSGSTEVDFQKMQDVAKKYGIDLASLGPAFQSARLHASAKDIINDFDLLVRGGADVGGVLFGMRGDISKLVSDSLKFGTTIPENMKPWIEELGRTHQLLGDNGDEITDLSGLKFAEPIKTEFQKIIDKLQELIDKISGTNGVTGALDKLPKDVTVGVHFDVDKFGVIGPEAPIPMARGGFGRVTKPTLFFSKGNEDFAFSGEGKSFDSDGVGGRGPISVSVSVNLPAGTNLTDPQALGVAMGQAFRTDAGFVMTALEKRIDSRIAQAA